METPQHTTNEVLRQEIAELEHRWASAALEGNESALRRLLADHAVVTFFDGVVAHGRRAVVAGLCARFGLLRDLDVTHTHVRLLGPEAALVTGSAVLDFRHEGQDLGGPVRYTRVWYRHRDRWQIVAAHTSSTAPAP